TTDRPVRTGSAKLYVSEALFPEGVGDLREPSQVGGDPGGTIESYRRGGCLALPDDCSSSEDLRQVAAVNDERGAGDVAAGVAGEEEGGADQLFGLAPAAQGGSAGKFVLLLLGKQAHGQVGQEWAGGQAVDGDAEGPQVVGAGP